MADYAEIEKGLREIRADVMVANPIRKTCEQAADAIAALTKQADDLSDELVDARLEPWPEWAEKLLRILQDFGAEYEADDEIDLPDELREWLHHYASDLKQAAERRAQ